jgi:hypothetical protein
MSPLTPEEIQKCFESSRDFNEIFDAFEQALARKIEDVGLYRTLFWNHSLTPDEICLFGEKVARAFPPLAYETYLWLARVFETTYSMFDNFKLAVEYYAKAAAVRPSEQDPYIRAADCYDADLNIPAVDTLIDFLRLGEDLVDDPQPLHQRLAYLYSVTGDHEKSEYYRRRAGEGSPPSPP